VILLYVWFRAFTIVSCTALNVTQVTQHHYVSAFFTGALLSFIWWTNTKTAAHSSVRGDHLAYTLGAGCGTVFGMYLGSLLQ
jgi:hypothetical protein